MDTTNRYESKPKENRFHIYTFMYQKCFFFFHLNQSLIKNNCFLNKCLKLYTYYIYIKHIIFKSYEKLFGVCKSVSLFFHWLKPLNIVKIHKKCDYPFVKTINILKL